MRTRAQRVARRQRPASARLGRRTRARRRRTARLGVTSRAKSHATRRVSIRSGCSRWQSTQAYTCSSVRLSERRRGRGGAVVVADRQQHVGDLERRVAQARRGFATKVVAHLDQGRGESEERSRHGEALRWDGGECRVGRRAEGRTSRHLSSTDGRRATASPWVGIRHQPNGGYRPRATAIRSSSPGSSVDRQCLGRDPVAVLAERLGDRRRRRPGR